MPELPEVETIKRGLEPALVDARFENVVQRRPDLRFPFPENFTARLRGRRVKALSRRSKYLLANLEGEEVLVMHLGMSGRFTIESCEKPGTKPGTFAHATSANPRHDHIVFHMSHGGTVTYNDPRRFGFMLLLNEKDLPRHRMFRTLGPEPLSNAFNALTLAAKAAGKNVDLKTFLMDQRVVAGLGNIYICEALHQSGLSPRRQAACLVRKSGKPTDRAERLVHAIRDVLTKAIVAGGSSLRDYRQADGALGYFQHTFATYGRDGKNCERDNCSGTIRRIIQAGRSSFYCPRCQH